VVLSLEPRYFMLNALQTPEWFEEDEENVDILAQSLAASQKKSYQGNRVKQVTYLVISESGNLS
jgi:hypothetical protein